MILILSFYLNIVVHHILWLPPAPPKRKTDNPQHSCLEDPVDREATWAAVYGVAQSRTRLKRLTMGACIGERNGNPFQYSCLENPRDGGAWWAAVSGVAQSRTGLKRLSSSKKNFLPESLPPLQCYLNFHHHVTGCRQAPSGHIALFQKQLQPKEPTSFFCLFGTMIY